MTVLQFVLAIGLLAYLLGVVFSIRYLLECWKRTKGVRMIMLAWLLVAVSQMRLVGGVDNAVESFNAGHSIEVVALLAASLLTALIVLKYGVSQSAFRLPLVLLMLYIIIGLFSMVWAPSVKIVAWKAAQMLVFIILSVASVARLQRVSGFRTLIELIYVIATLIMISSAVAGLIAPDQAYKQLYVGGGGLFGVVLYSVWPHMHPNTLGIYAAIMVVVAFRRFMDTDGASARMYYAGLLMLSLAVQFAAQSRGSIVALMAGLLVMALLWGKVRRVVAAVAVVATLAGVYQLVASSDMDFSIVEDYIKRGQSDEQFASMSGRSGLWEIGKVMIADRPLFGHGFQTGARFGGEKYGMPLGTNLHNSHFQVLVDSGFLGYFMWLGFLLIGAKKIYKLVDKHSVRRNEEGRFRLELLVIVVMLLIRTTVGRAMAGLDLALMLYMAMLLFAYNHMQRASERETAPVMAKRTILRRKRESNG